MKKELNLGLFKSTAFRFDPMITERMSKREKAHYLIEWAKRAEQELEVVYGILLELVSLEPNIDPELWELLSRACIEMGDGERAIAARENARLLRGS